MKTSKRILSLFLAILCVFTLMSSLSAVAFADSAYSTTSNRGVKLQYPKSSEYFEEPFGATVCASRPNGSIYFMPKPKSGNGHLGTVDNGSYVTILAEHGEYFFFETWDGRCGWNGKGYFDYDKDDYNTANNGRYSDSYPTVSTKGVELVFPKSYYDTPFYMTVKASRSNGSIYLMPKPKSGNGNLGKVRDGEIVTILAHQGYYYFFMTQDGRYGWNGTSFFE